MPVSLLLRCVLSVTYLRSGKKAPRRRNLENGSVPHPKLLHVRKLLVRQLPSSRPDFSCIFYRLFWPYIQRHLHERLGESTMAYCAALQGTCVHVQPGISILGRSRYGSTLS